MSDRRSGQDADRPDAVPKLDAHGHLVDAQDWTPAVACWLAAGDGIQLDSEQWWLIEYVREYHLAYGNPPLMRSLVQALNEARPDVSGSRHLYRLFPEGPVRLACKYGGLPPPDWCL